MRGELTFTNYLERMRSLVPFDFEEAVVFDKYLQLMGVSTQELQNVFKDLLELRSIDTAEGKQLDIIGKIVGQERELIDVDLFEFFGFRGDYQAGSFGTELDPSVGAVFKSVGDPTKGNIILTDSMYRIFIKAKIAKNVTKATPEDVMHFANFIFDTKGSSVEDEGGGQFRIALGRPMTSDEVGLIRYVNRTANFDTGLFPKPIGVRIWFSSFNHEQVFAFAGVPNARGFGGFDYRKYDGGIPAVDRDPHDGARTYDGRTKPEAKSVDGDRSKLSDYDTTPDKPFAFSGVSGNVGGFGLMEFKKFDGGIELDKGKWYDKANKYDGALRPEITDLGVGGYLATLHGEI